jgi:hypothetical protein
MLNTFVSSNQPVTGRLRGVLDDGIKAHTNTVEGFFSLLKRGIYGCYFHVSEEHLHRYLAEFDFRYSHRSALGIEAMQAEPFIAEHASNAIASIYMMCYSLNCRANANVEPYAHLRSGETLSVLVGQSACHRADFRDEALQIDAIKRRADLFQCEAGDALGD